MKEIGTSSLWEFKYKPTCAEDYICTDDVRKLLTDIIESKEVPTLLLCGVQGSGKTSLANVIASELDMDLLYINGSLDNSIDVVREDVTRFAMSNSLFGNKKLIVIDEADRLGGGIGASKGSNPAQDALKVLVEQTESNARFIFCTNNPQNIIPPLKSRCRILTFERVMDQKVLLQYFKRACFILGNENVKYDKQAVAEYTKKVFPDMRKLINGLQLYYQQKGEINEGILSVTDVAQITTLIEEMKQKKFNNIRKICSEIDPMMFYTIFYAEIVNHVQPESLPGIILTLSEYDYRSGLSSDKEICITACVVELMKEIKFR